MDNAVIIRLTHHTVDGKLKSQTIRLEELSAQRRLRKICSAILPSSFECFDKQTALFHLLFFRARSSNSHVDIPSEQRLEPFSFAQIGFMESCLDSTAELTMR